MQPPTQFIRNLPPHRGTDFSSTCPLKVSHTDWVVVMRLVVIVRLLVVVRLVLRLVVIVRLVVVVRLVVRLVVDSVLLHFRPCCLVLSHPPSHL